MRTKYGYLFLLLNRSLEAVGLICGMANIPRTLATSSLAELLSGPITPATSWKISLPSRGARAPAALLSTLPVWDRHASGSGFRTGRNWRARPRAITGLAQSSSMTAPRDTPGTGVDSETVLESETCVRPGCARLSWTPGDSAGTVRDS